MRFRPLQRTRASVALPDAATHRTIPLRRFARRPSVATCAAGGQVPLVIARRKRAHKASSLRFFADAFAWHARLLCRVRTPVDRPFWCDPARSRALHADASVARITPAGGSCVARNFVAWRRSATRSTFRSRAAHCVPRKPEGSRGAACGAARGVYTLRSVDPGSRVAMVDVIHLAGPTCRFLSVHPDV
jgi:hypothetical protein